MIWILTFLGIGCIILIMKLDMKKEYLLVGVGGMNGEIWNLEGRFDRLEDVIDWMVERKMNVWDEGNEEECRVDMNWMEVINWEGYYGDMNDGLDEWIDKDKESVNRISGLSESLELYELNVFGA